MWEIHINYLSFNGWLLFFASSRLFSSPTVMWGLLTHRQDNGSASKWSFIPTNLAVSLSDKLFALLFFLVFFLNKIQTPDCGKIMPSFAEKIFTRGSLTGFLTPSQAHSGRSVKWWFDRSSTPTDRTPFADEGQQRWLTALEYESSISEWTFHT